MPRTFALALIVLLTTPLPSLAQCDYRSTYSGAHRLTALDLAVDGNNLWVATSYGVTIYDRTIDPPAPVTSRALPGPTSEIEVVGSLAYAASGSTLLTLRRTGPEIEIVNSLDLGAVANDLIAVGQYLYVAASTGFIQVDLLIPDRPVVTSRLTTSSGPAFSVAHLDGLIYMADGDLSLQLYTVRIPALPQKAGTLDLALPATWVRVANNFVFVSDGFQTEIRVGDGIALGTGAFGGVAVAPHSAQVVYTASGDRRIRAVDLSSPSAPVILFEHQLPASSGTVNRVSDLAAVEGRLYVAAGDLGLVTFDARQFGAPFPLHAQALGATRSTFSTGSRLFTSPEAGALKEYSLSQSGSLTFVRQWDEGRVSTIQEGSASRLLTTSGATATIWDIGTTPPAALATANLRATIRGGVLSGESAILLLSDLSVWRVAAGQAPVQISVGDARPSHIARGGTGIALADLNESGTTTVRWYASGDLTTTPLVASIEGAATSGIAATASGFVAAVTFRGLLGVDFSSGTPQNVQFPRQGGIPARDLFASGNDLFVLTSSALEVWSISIRQLARTISIPSSSSHIHASELATVSTADGVAVINYQTASVQPQLVPIFESNTYYISATGSAGFVHLVREGAVRSLRVDPAGRLLSEHTTSIPAAARDVAAIGASIYSVSDSGRVTGPGVEFQMNEGADASALSLHAVKDALYLSIIRGCLSTGCEKKTLVLSTAGGSLTQTASLTGAMLDVDVNGNRAYALFDDPDEIRVLDVTSAAQPSALVTRASQGNPVSVAFAPGVAAVYSIGQKAYAYAAADLIPLGELLETYIPDPSGRVSYLDQELAVEGSCVIVAGREFAPRVYRIQSATQWQSVAAPTVPAGVRWIVTTNGAHYLLTDYSLEIWSSAPPLKRTRPVR